MTEVFLGVACFLAMEPTAAGAHRLIMHGRGWVWHRSHHTGRHDRWEENDFFPLTFAAFTVAAMAWAAGTGHPELLAAGAGVAGYGLAYLTVHDVCVHGRLTGGRPIVHGRWLNWVATGHAWHHRTKAAPYGFLAPVQPRAARRAASVEQTARMTEQSRDYGVATTLARKDC